MAATREQRRAAITACCGVPFLLVGGWLADASRTTGRYAWAETPGIVFLVIGLVATFGGLLWFAALRMKQ